MLIIHGFNAGEVACRDIKKFDQPEFYKNVLLTRNLISKIYKKKTTF
jgi:hypothetical protein